MQLQDEYHLHALSLAHMRKEWIFKHKLSSDSGRLLDITRSDLATESVMILVPSAEDVCASHILICQRLHPALLLGSRQ